MAILDDFTILKGDTIYTPMMGTVKVLSVNQVKDFVTLIVDNGPHQRALSIDIEGRWNGFEGAECIIFPSKECRDWNLYKKPLKIGTPCMARYNNVSDGWRLRWYAGRNDRGESLCNWPDGRGYRYDDIIPVDKFNFEIGAEQDNTHNYGLNYTG